MTWSADLAAALRERADALEALAELESDLADAKDAYASDPSADNKDGKRLAAEAVRDARARARATLETIIGGDAFVRALTSDGSED